MPDIKTCLVCKKIFDFEEGGFVEEAKGIQLFVCSEVCVVKSAIGEGKNHVIIIDGLEEQRPKPSLFDIHNLN